MVENILYRFYFFEEKDELHFIARVREPQQRGELVIVKVWVWNYRQGRSWMNTLKDDTVYKYPHQGELLEDNPAVMRYLGAIKADFFEMLFSGIYQ